MNNKAQITQISLIFIDIVFILFWAFMLSDLLTLAGNSMIDSGATGFEALVYSNLNMVVGLVFLLFNAMVLRGQ